MECFRGHTTFSLPVSVPLRLCGERITIGIATENLQLHCVIVRVEAQSSLTVGLHVV